MSLVLRSVKGSKLTIAEMDGNLTYLESLGIGITGPQGPTGTGAGITDVTYSELVGLGLSSSFSPGSFYRITDFRTCYDQPDFDELGNPITVGNWRQAEVDPIVVLAISNSSLAVDAWQPSYMKDTIKYDITWNQTEITGGTAYGRITERIDEWNNRTDYDHRVIQFVRYMAYEYNIATPLAGTVSFNQGAITGEGTTFTAHSPGTILAFPELSAKFFEVLTVDSDTSMSVTASNVNFNVSDTKYYIADSVDPLSYKRNNVDDQQYLFTTFGDPIENFSALNNCIGDHANRYVEDGVGSFLLANNVFISGPYFNNKFGNSCYNNTFDDECSDNTIGNLFYNNITNDGFGQNQIGNNFNNNFITANFSKNYIADNFENNLIVNTDFNENNIQPFFSINKFSYGITFERNQIDRNFNNNEIYADFGYETYLFDDDSRGNIIGEQFNNNKIYVSFGSNNVGNDFQFNTIGEFSNIGAGEFTGNTLGHVTKGNLFLGYSYNNNFGSGFTDNQLQNPSDNILGVNCILNDIGNNFRDNRIGNEFSFNVLGTDFQRNVIGNDFNGNTIQNNFSYNHIGEHFQNNVIDNDFGFGGAQVYGNVIGSYFENNNIGEYFYSNTIQDLFSSNNIGDYFQFNEVKSHYVNSYNFLLGKIISFTDDAGASPSATGIDGTYYDLAASGGSGQNATFDLTVAGSVVTTVTLNNPGNSYSFLDVLTISDASISRSISILVGSVSTTAAVYGNFNCTIFRNADGNNRLSYYDTNDVLTINTSITQ